MTLYIFVLEHLFIQVNSIPTVNNLTHTALLRYAFCKSFHQTTISSSCFFFLFAETRHLPASRRCIDPRLAVTKFVRTGEGTEADIDYDADMGKATGQSVSEKSINDSSLSSETHVFQHSVTTESGNDYRDRHTVAHYHTLRLSATLSHLSMVWRESICDTTRPAFTAKSASDSNETMKTDVGCVYQFVIDRCAAIRQQLVRLVALQDICNRDGEIVAEYEAIRSLYVRLCTLYVEIWCICCFKSVAHHAMSSEHLCSSEECNERVFYEWFDEVMHVASLNACVAAGLHVPFSRTTCDVRLTFDSSYEMLQKLDIVLHLHEGLSRAFNKILATGREPSLTSAHKTSANSSASQVPTPSVTAIALLTPIRFPYLSSAINKLQANNLRSLSFNADSVDNTSFSTKSQAALLELAGHIRRSNPSSALRTVVDLVRLTKFSQLSISGNMEVYHSDSLSIEESEWKNALCYPAYICALLAMLPSLRLWRMLLLNQSANKGEAIPLHR